MVRHGRRAVAVALTALLAACGGDDAPVAAGPFAPPAAPVPLAQVSGTTPFAATCDLATQAGTVYPSAEVEPWVAVDPLDPDHLVGTWQQDRWSNGGARGLLAAVSTDGGQTWVTRQAPFSRCTGGNTVNGGDYLRATDPWVSVGADGTIYWMAMTIVDAVDASASAMRVSRSTDGGATWDAPITLIHDVDPYTNDKNAITADPTDARYAYAVWDRLDASSNTGPAYFTRTTDGGLSWQTPRAIYDPGSGAQTLGNQVVVLTDGTLLNLFTEIHFASSQADAAYLRVVRSTDQGATWGAPVTVAEMLTVGVRDPETGTAIRSGAILGAIAAGPDDALWVAWQDARFSGGERDGIALARSGDGGLSWSAPVRVNSAAGAPAFTPAVRVAGDGTVGVLYYDLRDNTADPGTLLTNLWLAASADDGVSWTERLVSGPFDLALAPNALGLFVGDYVGLGGAGSNFVPFFAQTFPSLENRTNVYTVALPVRAARATAKAAPTYGAAAAPPLAMTAEWALRIEQTIERNRHQFPDRLRPGQLPQYLR